MKKPLTPKLRRIIIENFKRGLSTYTIASELQMYFVDVERVIRDALREKDKRTGG